MRIHCTVYIAAAELILRKILAGMFLQCFLVEGMYQITDISIQRKKFFSNLKTFLAFLKQTLY